MILRHPLARAALLAASTALATWPLAAARAQQAAAPGAPERAVITADELTHDRALDTVTARGGVEIDYAGRILMADTVSYQIGKDFATAAGDVTLLEPDGTTVFADYVELENELKEGLVREIRVLLKDGSRAAARGAIRSGDKTVMRYGVYTACDACEDDPSAPPVWQVKAAQVVHDQAKRDLIYRDAWLEVAGVPVLYTPYLSHPDPTVKRRSGFLPPTYGGTSGLGATITTPYYHALSPQHDVTFAPMMTTDQGPVMAGEHRLAFDRGRIVSEGSITQDNSGRIRNHINSESRIDIDETWRAGADIALASDDTYLRRYGFTSPSFLTTRPYVEGFGRRSYAFAEGYYFQNMVETATAESPPVVAPLAGWNFVSAPGRRGGWHTASVNTAAIERDKGADSRRFSLDYGWHLPHTGPIGDLYTLDVGLRGDLYHVNDVVTGQNATAADGFTGRVLPSAAMTWSLPLERGHPTFHEVVEPIIMGVLSPRGQNSEKIPNEDSLDFEFDETNLFDANRFPGFDRVEGGPRINYGLRYAAYGGSLGRFTATLGQSWHAFPDGSFNPKSGIDEPLSDYVGQVTMQPSTNFNVGYRFRLDKDNLTAQRSNLSVAVGPPALRLSGNYLSLVGAPLQEGGIEQTETLQTRLSSEISRYWTVGADTRYDLVNGRSPLSVGGDVAYEDECLAVAFSGAREFVRDRDFEGGFRVGLRVVLKTLGEAQTSTTQ